MQANILYGAPIAGKHTHSLFQILRFQLYNLLPLCWLSQSPFHSSDCLCTLATVFNSQQEWAHPGRQEITCQSVCHWYIMANHFICGLVHLYSFLKLCQIPAYIIAFNYYYIKSLKTKQKNKKGVVDGWVKKKIKKKYLQMIYLLYE